MGETPAETDIAPGVHCCEPDITVDLQRHRVAALLDAWTEGGFLPDGAESD